MNSMACFANKCGTGCIRKATKTTLKTANNTKYQAKKAATARMQQVDSNSNYSVWQLSDSNQYCCCCGTCRKNNYNTSKINKQRPLAFNLIIMIAIMQLIPQTKAMPHVAKEAATNTQRLTLEALESSLSGTTSLRAASTQNVALIPARKRKRHSNYLFFHNNMHESTTELEWENPCGGVFEPQAEQELSAYDGTLALPPRPPIKQYLALLRQNTRSEFHTLQEAQSQPIDISDMSMWKLHRHRYKFLPKLKRTSGISLKRWYASMQTFVASFAYLGRTQYKWDRSKQQHASPVTHELNELLMSARRILCEIETTINGSYPNSAQQKLTRIGRAAMNRRLKFRTRDIESKNGLSEAEPLDLIFAKHFYYNYLTTMWKILRRETKRKGQITLYSGSVEQTSAGNSAMSDSKEALNLSLNSILREESADESAAISNASQSVEIISLKPKRHQRKHSQQSAELTKDNLV